MIMKGFVSSVPVLAFMAAVPASAEMFGPGFQPCGDKPSTLAVVECVQAETNAADQRLNYNSDLPAPLKEIDSLMNDHGRCPPT
jgi:hypothetical protein